MQYIDGGERPPIIEMLRKSVQNPGYKLPGIKADSFLGTPDRDDGLLHVRQAKEWIALERHKPNPKMLFGNFWLQGELCILFADTNMGKSILAVQLGDSISKQQPINGFELDAPASPVLYIDFELSSKQFEVRYSDCGGNYNFGDNFYRAEVNATPSLPKQFENFNDYMAYAIHRAIKTTDARVLIIDNITSLGGSTEQSGRALTMMKLLKGLKTRHELSILVLAHTPKRKAGLPIGRNDLGGSKMLINFADSAFAMAPSGTQPHLRYLKQVKQRSAIEVYGADNVCLFKFARKGGLLCFEFLNSAPEHEHLRRPDEHDRERLIQQAISLQSQGHTQRQIAAHLRMSLGKVNKLLYEGEMSNIAG